MKQISLGLNLNVKKTRKREFLEEMERVVPWQVLCEVVEPHYPKGKTGRPPMGVQTMLRVHYMQQWFGLSDPAMEEALHEVPLYREFAKLDDVGRIPDESTILRFRHLLEKHDLAADMLRVVNDLLSYKGLMLKTGSAIDATLISAPSSTKNAEGERDPEMHQAKKGKQWYFGMKAHIGVDAASGYVHSVATTAANASDVTQVQQLLHGAELNVYADAGYQGVNRRMPGSHVNWHVAMRPGKRRALDKKVAAHRLIDEVERAKASIRAKVEHPFRVIKRQFGYVKVRYRGIKKNTGQIVTLFALSNLWMARKKLMILQGSVRVQTATTG
jgi:transposase, IS5 family